MSRPGGKRGKAREASQDGAGEAKAGSDEYTLTQEEVATRVPCARSTVQRMISLGDIIADPVTGRLSESAIEFLRGKREEDEESRTEIRGLNRRLLAAQAGEREAKMKLRELELERERGAFVELASVQRSGADAAQRILAVLRALPQRIALEVDAALSVPADRRAAAIEKIASREVERAIDEMKRSLYLQAGTASGTSDETA